MYQDLPPAGDGPRSDQRELVKLLHAIAPGHAVTVIDSLCLPIAAALAQHELCALGPLEDIRHDNEIASQAASASVW
jgi:hypothetical protein